MRRRHFPICFGIFALVGAILLGGDPAQALTLQGAVEQGGMAIGHTNPGDTVTLDGEPVTVDASGLFVIGFGRDAAAQARLSITAMSGDTIGQTQDHILTVKPRRWSEQHINGLPPKKVTPPDTVLRRIRADNKAIKNARLSIRDTAMFVSGFTMPVDGRTSGVFGSRRILNGQPRSPHSGHDIAATTGTEVKAAADGVISLVAQDMYFTGQTIMIDHGLGLQSVYAHLSAITVASGQTVRRGEVIGRVGATGRATGPHLHWGISWREHRLDPETIVRVWPHHSK
jgi:hypothetical protein